MQLWHSPFFDGGVENCPSSVGLYRVFNPLALWALPLYRCTTQGERIEKRSFSLCCFCAPPCCGARQGEEGCQSPPLCFAKQNIGEVSRSDGGVEKTRLCLFILLNSEKNEPRSSGSYRAIRLVATVAVGVCGTRSARTVLALFPPSPLRLHRPIKADRVLLLAF